jgi:hypothetical protein
MTDSLNSSGGAPIEAAPKSNARQEQKKCILENMKIQMKTIVK